MCQIEGHLSRISELAVAFYLKGGEVEEWFWCLVGILLLNVRDDEGLALDEREGLLALFLARVLAGGSGKLGVTIDSCEHPIGFWLEVVYLPLPVHDECERRCLHASDTQGLAWLSVLDAIESCGVDAE